MRLSSRVHTRATPAQVWQLLGSPAQWPRFEPLLGAVRGAHGPAAAGQHLLGIARGLALRVPVDVLEAVPERRLVLRIATVPGLREEVTYEVTSALRGGCDLSVSVVADGLFARPAVLSLWLAARANARLLQNRADRLAANQRRGRDVA